MKMGFNFNAFVNLTYPVTLNLTEDGDVREREIHVRAPSVARYKEYVARASGPKDTDMLLALCAEILSNNREGCKVAP